MNEKTTFTSTPWNEATPWNTGWIDRIYNNTNRDWYIKSVDDRFNGKLKEHGGGEVIELDGGQWHRLKKNTRYNCEWCAIPWYWEGKHYKLLSGVASKAHYVECFTSSVEGKNWVYYMDATGDEVARQKAPNNDAFRLWLRIDDEKCLFYIVNDTGGIIDTLIQLHTELNKWIDATLDRVAKIVDIIAKIGKIAKPG